MLRRCLLLATAVVGLAYLVIGTHASGLMLASSHSVTGLSVMSAAPRQAAATVTVSGEGTVHVRFALAGTGEWSSATDATAGAGDTTVSVDLQELAPNADYEVQASSVASFPDTPETLSVAFTNRPAHLDFELAASHGRPVGVAGDASIFWIAGAAPGSPSRLMAYNGRGGGETYGTRALDRDIETPDNQDPKGVWADATTVFVVDGNDRKVYAYRKLDGSRDQTKEFDLHDDHDDPRGVWANADSFWIVNDSFATPLSNLIVAYRRAPGAGYGTRDPAKDIGASEVKPRAIWSDGTTMWGTDDSESTGRRVFGYNVESRASWPLQEIDLVDEEFNGHGLWGAGDILWLLDQRSGASVVTGHYRPHPRPSVSSIVLTSATSATATARVGIAYLGQAGATVHVRHRPRSSAQWSTPASTQATGSVDVTLTAVLANAPLQVQASLDSTFSDGAEFTARLNVRPIQHDVDLIGASDGVRGIWTDGETMWVVNEAEGAGSVDAYDLTTGAHDQAKGFALVDANSAPRDVFADTGTMWVVDGGDHVYAYNIAEGASFGTPISAMSFDLDTDAGMPTGAWSDGTTLWAASHVRERMHAYNFGTSGVLGERDTAREGSLSTSYRQPKGMWSDGDTLWLVFSELQKLLAYTLTDEGIWTRLPTRDIRLLYPHYEPWGVASHGDIVWVTNEPTGTVSAYSLPPAVGENITGVALDRIDMTEADITVTIKNPDASARSVRLEWVITNGVVIGHATETSSGMSATFRLTGLKSRGIYDLWAAVDDNDPQRVATIRTLTVQENKHRFLKHSVVEAYETSGPWVRRTYDQMRRLGITVGPLPGGAGRVITRCDDRVEGPHTCDVISFDIGRAHSTSTRIYLHELGHVYTIGTDFIGETDEAVGVGWLYFTQLASQGRNCIASELYADALLGAMSPGFLTYFNRCSVIGSRLSAEALAVAQSILDEEVPSWLNTKYGDNSVPYDTSADVEYDNKYYLEPIWDDLKDVSSRFRVGAAQAFSHAFGGYCDDERAHESAFHGGSTRNPWRAGGCVPQAPPVTLAADGLITWQEPAYDGGEGIDAYLVEWRSRSQEFDSSRSVEVTDLARLSYQAPDLGAGGQVRVSARNVNGWGEFTVVALGAAVVPTPAALPPDSPTIVEVIGRHQELNVTWDAPTDDGGVNPWRYDLHYIRTDDEDKADETRWTELSGAWSHGDGALSSSVTGLEDDVQYDLQVRAVTAVAASPWSSVVIGTPQPLNRSPRFPADETGIRTVPENTPSNRSIGAPIVATDPEGDALGYIIQPESAASLFAVDLASGQLRTKADLNHEGVARYSFEVWVTDWRTPNDEYDLHHDAEIPVTIVIADVDEPPEIRGDRYAEIEEDGSRHVGRYVGLDPEGVDVTWDLSGPDLRHFRITAAGGLRFAAVPDYEEPGDVERDNVYEVTVTASDGRYFVSMDVEVVVTDAIEAPVGGGGPPRPLHPLQVEEDVFSDLAAAGVHEGSVRALAADGVLDGTGCERDRLCPQEPIARWESVVWLVRILDGADPAAVGKSRFADVADGVWWAAHAERLADLEILLGCSLGPARLCPDEMTTRAQMASLLARAFRLLPTGPAGFADTEGSVHERNIDALFEAGITVGCRQEPLSFCPRRSTTRAQMATFLHRAVTR